MAFVNGKVFGVFSADYPEPRQFTADYQRLFRALAQRAGLAIENAHLYTQAQAAERQRLARELHDSVTQTLFSASLIAEVLPRLWARRPEQGSLRLRELKELTRGALAEMRTLLQERALGIDAALQVQSAPGSGTTLSLRWPPVEDCERLRSPQS